MRMMGVAVLCVSALFAAPSAQAQADVLRLGLVKFGSAAWEADHILHAGLDKQAGLDIRIVDLANPEAGKIALAAGSVDMIVSDWLWASQMRAQGRAFSFLPYSSADGAVMARPDSGIAAPADLKGKRLGVAGGALDKSWILFQAYARRVLGLQPGSDFQVEYGAPPLLGRQLQDGGLDAILTYWHYAAKLRAQGLRTIVAVDQTARALGLDGDVAWLGWVYDDAWSRAHPQAARRFYNASRQAKAALLNDDAAWLRLKPLMRIDDDSEYAQTVAAFRAGIPGPGPLDLAKIDAIAAALTGAGANHAVFPDFIQ